MVVPPGEATRSFRTPGCSPVSRTMEAAPKTVWAARRVATSRGSPILTPPSDKASMQRKTNAGPEPESPVTASNCRSFRTTTRPTDSNIRRTRSNSPAVTPSPGARALIPRQRRAGVLGITRTIRTFFPRAASIRFIGTPAAMETISAPLSTAGAISRATGPTPSGFTARTTISEAAASRFSPVTRMPYRCSRVFNRSRERSAAIISPFL